MAWPFEAFLNLRQILTPKSRPPRGGNLLYVKADNELYLMDSDGTEHQVGGSGTVGTVVAGDQITVDSTNPASPVVSTTGLVKSVTAGANVTVDNTDPKNPVVSGPTPGGRVDSVVAGVGVHVDNVDPANPVVSVDVGDAGVQFKNTDKVTLAADNTDAVIALSRIPKAGSEHAYWNGLGLQTSDWTRDNFSLTVPAQTFFKANDVFWVDYAFDPSGLPPGPVITSPADGSSSDVTTPTFTGTGTPARSLSVLVDGTSVGTTTVASDGTWSITSSALSVSAHTAVALQSEPDGTTQSSNTVTFTVTKASYLSVMSSLGPLWYGRLNEASGTTMVDSSGNGRNGNYYGGGYTLGFAGIIPSMSDTCVDFAGAGNGSNVAEIPYGAWMDGGTIGLVAWVTPDVLTQNQGLITRDWYPSGRCWELRISSSGKAEFFFWTTTGGPYGVGGATTLSAGDMVAASYDGTTAKVYVNGVVDGTLTQPGTLMSAGVNISLGVAHSGSGGAPTDYFNGRMQGPAIFTSLTAANVSDLWTAGN